MNPRLSQLRRNRDACAAALLDTVHALAAHDLHVQKAHYAMVRGHLPDSHFQEAIMVSVALIRRQAMEKQRFKQSQRDWHVTLHGMEENQVGAVLQCSREDFVLDWLGIQSAFDLGRHLDVTEWRWSELKMGHLETHPMNLNEAMQSLVAAGATEATIAQLYKDVAAMEDVLGATEYHWPCYLARGLQQDAQNAVMDAEQIIQDAVPAFRAAIACYPDVRMQTINVLSKASRRPHAN